MRTLAPTLLLAALLAVPVAGHAELATVTVTRSEAEARYQTDGVVEAARQSVLSAQTAGRVTERAVDAGDRIKSGQVLVRIDDADAEQAERASQAQVVAARAQLANAQAELDRARRLHAQQFVSQAALENAQMAYRTARAQVDALTASAGVSTTQRGYNTVSAPYSAVVAQAHAQVGDLAMPGTPLLTVYDPARLRVIASLPQAQLAAWRRERPVLIELVGADGTSREVEPRQVTVMPVTDPSSQIVQIRLDLPEDLDGALPGTFTRVWFPLAAAQQISVPTSALLVRGEMTAVYVVAEDGRVSLRQVRLGKRSGEQVAIAAGLLEGERVALDPRQAARVRAQEAAR
jgi:membrane fusion protein, multidrug efflux system